MYKEFNSVTKIRQNIDGWISHIKSIATAELYKETLRLQMKITEPEVIKYLVNDKHWNNAKEVLDLGCGPGFLISTLYDFFPKKEYAGVDLNEEFISFAKENFRSRATFYQSDIYSFNLKQKYDYLHVRALLQHLPDVPSFVDVLLKLTKSGSSILFLDSPGSEIVNSDFIPDIPSYKIFFEQLASAQKAKGGNRDCLLELEKSIEGQPFEVITSEDFFVPSTGDLSREIYFFYIYFVCELLDRMYDIASDKKAFIGELLHWYDSPVRYAQFHGKWVQLLRK